MNDYLKTYAILRDKENNDEPLTPAERRTLKRILKAHPWLTASLSGDYVKGCRD